MAVMNLLEMTQEVLSSLGSDEVNSISDTTESMQVARIIRNKYYDILTRGDLPSQQVLLQLTASGDSTKPIQMTVPSGVSNIQWIKYFDSNPQDSQQVSQFGAYSHGVNSDISGSGFIYTTSSTSNSIGTGSKTFTVASGLDISTGDGLMCLAGTASMFGYVTSYSSTTLVINVTSTVGTGTYTSWTITNTTQQSIPGYKYVKITGIDTFLDMVNKFNPSESNVSSFTFEEGDYDFTLYFKNDIQPSFCTIIENTYVLFDSYDSTMDSTLQASKTLVFGQKVSEFELEDTATPDIDEGQFPLLLNEARAWAFLEMKQMPHQKAEQEIRRQWSAIQKEKSVSNKPSYFDQLPNMGRIPRTGGYGGYLPYRWMRGL